MKTSTKKKVLIVDDDDNLRLALKDKLDMEGFEALEAKDGKEGLDKALENHPDIILLDLLMPVMNGLETLKALREDPWGKDAKVIVLTVLDTSGSVAEAMARGSFTYIVKTDLNADDIVKKIREVIKA